MPSTRNRVPAHTAERVNREIQHDVTARVRYYEHHVDEIADRLDELDREWDIERVIEMNASALAFFGVAMASRGNRRWLVLPALVTGFLFQHAVQGWCPPIPVLRRMGFRTTYEIDEERQALKALRGDFQNVVRSPHRARAALQAARA